MLFCTPSCLNQCDLAALLLKMLLPVTLYSSLKHLISWKKGGSGPLFTYYQRFGLFGCSRNYSAAASLGASSAAGAFSRWSRSLSCRSLSGRSSFSSYLFNKLIFASDCGRLRLTFKNRVRNRGCIQLDCADRVIVTWNNIVNTIGIAVGINNAYNWDTQLVGFIDRDTLVININTNRISGRPFISLIPPMNVLKLVLHARAHQNFFLGQLFKGTISFLSFQLAESDG